MDYKYGWKHFWNTVLDNFYKNTITKYTATQYIKTPFKLAKEIISKIPDLDGDILVFNIEFAIYLIEELNINPDKIVLWYDNDYKLILAMQLGIFKVIPHEKLFDGKHIYVYNLKTKESIDMKFSAIIGNPAYDKNFHLKMLKKVMGHLNENGTCVWLHPARWIQDPLGPYKQGTDFKKYKDLPWVDFDIIPRGEANKLFGINNDSDLMVSTLKAGVKNEVKPIIDDEANRIVTKVQNKMQKSIKDVSDIKAKNGIRVPIKSIVPIACSGNRDYTYKLFSYAVCYDYYANNGYLNSGEYWSENARKNQYSRNVGDPMPLSIEFKSTSDAQNFIDSTHTEVYKFICILFKKDMHTHIKYIPFMEDYSKPWTNEMFIEYFNFNKDEVNYIMKEIKKYS